MLRPYHLSDKLISTEAAKGPNETRWHLLAKGIGLQQSIAQLHRGLITKYSRTVNVTVIRRSKNVSYLTCINRRKEFKPVVEML